MPISLNNLVFNGGDLAPWALISGDKVRVASHRMDYLTPVGKFFDLKAGWDDEDFFQNPAPVVSWSGIGNKYFAVLLTAADPYTLYQARTYRVNGKAKDEIMTVGARLAPFLLGAGESKEFRFRYYSGPKVIAQLDAFDRSTGRVMHLAWGPLDYLILDFPPGTGDEALSACQMITGNKKAVIVTTPQEVSLADCRKCVDFCKQLEVPVTGIIENMSGFVCPDCKHRHEIFSSGGGRKLAELAGTDLLAQLPLDPVFLRKCDEGDIASGLENSPEIAGELDKAVSLIVAKG